jgi:predicted NBD/HSP70 family sugar kinase
MIERIGKDHAKDVRISGMEIGHICAMISSATEEDSQHPYEMESFCGQAFFRRHTKQSFDRLLQRATAHDEEALRLFEIFGANVGALTATIETIFQPDRIIISGGLSRALRFFSPTMRRVHALRRFPKSLPAAAISPSSFGPELGAYGAALIGWKTFHY